MPYNNFAFPTLYGLNINNLHTTLLVGNKECLAIGIQSKINNEATAIHQSTNKQTVPHTVYLHGIN